MKKIIFIIVTIILASNISFAQKLYFTKNGHINFYSSTPIENIEADNRSVTSIINTVNGDIEFSVLIAAFQFEKALMQEHFNENYMESAKFPKSIFKGRINNIDKIDFTADGTYTADVSGDITIHGVTKPISTEGTFIVKNGVIKSNAVFNLKPADFNIEIPALVRNNIAKEIKVTVKNTYEPFSK